MPDPEGNKSVWFLVFVTCYLSLEQQQKNNRNESKAAIKPGTWNIPEHSGTFRNIPEHEKIKIFFYEKMIN